MESRKPRSDSEFMINFVKQGSNTQEESHMIMDIYGGAMMKFKYEL